MKAMSAIPPTVPPTMAPKLGVVEGAVAREVLVPVGVLVDWDKPEVGGLAEPETVGSGIDSIEELLDTVELRWKMYLKLMNLNLCLQVATEMLEEVAAEELNTGISIANSRPTVQ